MILQMSSSSSSSSLCSMNKEFVIDSIMSRLDGPTLAASGSACSDLRAAASDQTLWKNLCTASWPSTVAAFSNSSSGFDRFYADAFPLILCQPPSKEANPTRTLVHHHHSDFVSFVDLYYKGKPILSKSLDAIPNRADDDNNNTIKDNSESSSDELRQWLVDCPFRLDLLPSYDDTDILPLINEYDIDTPTTISPHDDCITYLESLTASTDDNRKRGVDLRDELAEDIRLSWILFDKKNGKAVNLSSWKPMFVQKSWVPDGEYVLHFGSIIPVQNTSLVAPHKFAECKIVARCQLINTNSGYVKWTEISMRVEDMKGAHLNTTRSLGVLNQALHCKRSTKHLLVERANNEYKIYKKEMKRRHDRREFLVDKLYALTALAAFTTIAYALTTLFQ